MTIQADHEQEIKEWALVHRSEFESRTDFNLVICTMLAQKGIPPLAGVVLRVGNWGSSTSVASDVALWFASIGERLTQMEAEIPLPARRAGNALIEQLWKLANSLTTEQLVRPLQTQLQDIENQRREASAQKDQLHIEKQKLIGEIESRNQQIQHLNAELTATPQGWDKERSSWMNEKTALRDETIRLSTVNLSLGEQIKAHQSANDQLKKDWSAANAQVNGLTAKAEFLQQSIAQEQQRSQLLATQIADERSRNQAITHQNKELSVLYQKALDEKNDHFSQCKALEERLSETQRMLSEVNTAALLAKERANQWQSWCQQAQDELKNAQLQAQRQAAEIGDLKRQLEDIRHHVQNQKNNTA